MGRCIEEVVEETLSDCVILSQKRNGLTLSLSLQQGDIRSISAVVNVVNVVSGEHRLGPDMVPPVRACHVTFVRQQEAPVVGTCISACRRSPHLQDGSNPANLLKPDLHPRPIDITSHFHHSLHI